MLCVLYECTTANKFISFGRRARDQKVMVICNTVDLSGYLLEVNIGLDWWVASLVEPFTTH